MRTDSSSIAPNEPRMTNCVRCEYGIRYKLLSWSDSRTVGIYGQCGQQGSSRSNREQYDSDDRDQGKDFDEFAYKGILLVLYNRLRSYLNLHCYVC